ncbi:hypothetical protein N7513_006342 [Penicillium frequentans]|nr:hypothetical protein N7513_006342 [Penicillium glabrum]
MAANTTRYKTDPPFGAIVLQDRQNLNDMVHNNPETVLNPENGGYYLKTMDGEVLAITGDDLCVELDAALASVDDLDSAEHIYGGPIVYREKTEAILRSTTIVPAADNRGIGSMSALSWTMSD